MYDHLVQAGEERRMQVLCMYNCAHLCVGRKREVAAGVVYVWPPVYRSEGGCSCRCCVYDYVHQCTDRKGEAGAGVFTYAHLCTGRKGEADADVVYV